MLGSLSEADDALQETWLRLSRSDTSGIENLGGWLTTVMARVCLNVLRSRRTRKEDPLPLHTPDPIVDRDDRVDPEHQALLADAVGLALLVVLDTLPPAERLAFVLHDMFAVPFDEIAPIVERSPDATRQLASRARRRVQARSRARHRRRPAAHGGRRVPRRVARRRLRRAPRGARPRRRAARRRGHGRRAARRRGRGGGPGAHVPAPRGRPAHRARQRLGRRRSPRPHGRPMAIMAFTVTDDRIVEIDILADPARVAALDLSVLDDAD